jgi:hypothetical protein
MEEVSHDEFESVSNIIIIVQAGKTMFESKGNHNCNGSISFDVNVTHWGGRNFNCQVLDPFILNDKALFCMPKSEIFKIILPKIIPHVLMQPKDDCKGGHDLVDAILEHHINIILTFQGHHSHWVNNFANHKTDFTQLQMIKEKWTWSLLTKHQVNFIIQKIQEEHLNRIHSY